MNRYKVVRFSGNNAKEYSEYLRNLNLNDKIMHPPLVFKTVYWWSERETEQSEIAQKAYKEYKEKWRNNFDGILIQRK